MDAVTPFAFKRNLTIPPLIIKAGTTPVPAQTIGGSALAAKRVSTFKVGNPCPFWVWYRGWTGAASDMPIIGEMGHHVAPGAIDINTSQYPDWIAAVAVDELGAPIFDASGASLYTNAQMAKARLVMLFGSGL